MTAALWRPATVAGALIIVAAGLLVAWRGPRWPVMSSRYEPPEQAGGPPAADSAALWDALSSGADPTLQARGDDPPRTGEGAGQRGSD